MRLVTYRSEVAAAGRLGAIVGDVVVDLFDFGMAINEPLPDTMLEFIDMGPHAVRATSKLLDEYADNLPLVGTVPLAYVQLLAPFPGPRKNDTGSGLNSAWTVDECRCCVYRWSARHIVLMFSYSR